MIVVVLLSEPRFHHWAIRQAKRHSERVLVVVNKCAMADLGTRDPSVTWLEGPPGKPESLTVAGRWLQQHAPDELVIQHDQDDYYPEGSARLKLEALRGADIVGSPVRSVWFESGPESGLSREPIDNHWQTWGGSYAWRVSAFVPDSGPSVLRDDVRWVDKVVRAGGRFAEYESVDTYCRWRDHDHVWHVDDRQFRKWLRPKPMPLNESIHREAVECGCMLDQERAA